MAKKTIINMADVTGSDGTHTITADAQVSAFLEVTDITFEKTATPTEWDGITPLAYTITLTNNGTEAYSGVEITDKLDSAVVFEPSSFKIDDTISTNFSGPDGDNILTIGDQEAINIPAGDYIVVTFQVTKKA